jgi:hypothetical protein
LKKKLGDVFKTVGLPQYTYVKPTHYGEIRSDIDQEGKHLLIEGPSGIGKTCVVFKVFEDLGFHDDNEYLYISCRESNAVDIIDGVITEHRAGRLSYAIIFLDDFHILPETYRNSLGDRLKQISDQVFLKQKTIKFILVGIPAAGGSILAQAGDLGPRIGGYRFSAASDKEINTLIDEGENALNILFEDRDIILSEASGNFWLAQYVCNKICSIKEVYETRELDKTSILTFDLLTIRKRILAELSTRFMETAVAFAKGKKWRPGGNKPYLELLLALAKIPDSVVPFDKLLGLVSDRRRPGIRAIKPRIASVIFNQEENVDLRKQIAFEDPSFSIEDPLFRYFLSHLSEDDLYQELGLSKDSVERDSIYTYDVAFSFAGEVRQIVERLNDELKEQDVVTFYDFDQQSMLLGDDLEQVLRSIYATSAKYYVIFMDDAYAQKVWTKFEKDIMTHSSRSRHIIPVVLTELGKSGLVGISSTLGRIDLSDVWSDYKGVGRFSDDNISAIRNRAVLPLIEKVDEFPAQIL